LLPNCCASFGYEGRSHGLRDLRLPDVEAFITVVGARVGRITMQSTVAILRSFLGFLIARGEAPAGLDRHIESPRQYRGERLVRALQWDTVLALLGQSTGPRKGRPDYAMLLLIATYGLRASEIAALRLEDVMWRARVIRVPRPKIGTPLAVPLTDEVACRAGIFARVPTRPVISPPVSSRARALRARHRGDRWGRL
jgi:integrase